MNSATSKSKLSDLEGLYTQEARKLNLLVLGEHGSGKTKLIETAPRPIVIDSFDPQGADSLTLSPGLYVDNRWEEKTPRQPSAFRDWNIEFNKRVQEDFFSSLGTYAIDSLTFMSTAWQREYAHKNGRKEGALQLQDYKVMKYVFTTLLTEVTQLPCNIIITGHLKLEKDEVSGRNSVYPDIIGSLQSFIPSAFSEYYVAMVRRSSKGNEHVLLTRNNGLYKARTRLGGGKLEEYEEPNIKHLMKKMGLSSEDKEY